MFDNVFWRDILSILIVFFKSYVQRVLLHFRPFAIVSSVLNHALNPRNLMMRKKTASSVNHVHCGVIGLVLVLQ